MSNPVSDSIPCSQARLPAEGIPDPDPSVFLAIVTDAGAEWEWVDGASDTLPRYVAVPVDLLAMSPATILVYAVARRYRLPGPGTEGPWSASAGRISAICQRTALSRVGARKALAELGTACWDPDGPWARLPGDLMDDVRDGDLELRHLPVWLACQHMGYLRLAGGRSPSAADAGDLLGITRQRASERIRGLRGTDYADQWRVQYRRCVDPDPDRDSTRDSTRDNDHDSTRDSDHDG